MLLVIRTKSMRADDTIVTEGNLSYYRAQSTVVSVQTSMADVKLCRIQFGSDGSIYIPLPYLNAKRGLLSEILDHPSSQAPFTYDLAKNGVTVDYDVKFSHHSSGVVRFSKTGKQDAWPRRRSFPLSSEIGLLFQLQVHLLSGLKWVTKPERNDLPLTFSFPDTHPVGIKLIAHWRRKSDIRASVHPAGESVGPRSEGIHKPTGAVHRWAFLGQPAASPLNDHVLMLAVEPVAAIDGADVPTMVFLGGFNPHEITPSRPRYDSVGCLAFMYPCRAPETRKDG
jgi:hypothetical protein